MIENQEAILVFSNETKTLISTEKIITKKAEFPFDQTLVSRDNGFYNQITNLNEKEIIST